MGHIAAMTPSKQVAQKSSRGTTAQAKTMSMLPSMQRGPRHTSCRSRSNKRLKPLGLSRSLDLPSPGVAAWEPVVTLIHKHPSDVAFARSSSNAHRGRRCSAHPRRYWSPIRVILAEAFSTALTQEAPAVVPSADGWDRSGMSEATLGWLLPTTEPSGAVCQAVGTSAGPSTADRTHHRPKVDNEFDDRSASPALFSKRSHMSHKGNWSTSLPFPGVEALLGRDVPRSLHVPYIGRVAASRHDVVGCNLCCANMLGVAPRCTGTLGLHPVNQCQFLCTLHT